MPSKKRKLWSEDETKTLENAVKKYGHKWTQILNSESIFKTHNRTAVDLKDKWRNILNSVNGVSRGRPRIKSRSRSRSRSRSPLTRKSPTKISKNSTSKKPSSPSPSPHHSRTFTIYTIEGCPYCKKAKDLVTKNGKHFKEIVVTNQNKRKIYSKIDSMTGMYRYFPIIFVGNRFIGGFTELQKIYT
jgi:glutaredoxin 3